MELGVDYVLQTLVFSFSPTLNAFPFSFYLSLWASFEINKYIVKVGRMSLIYIYHTRNPLPDLPQLF